VSVLAIGAHPDDIEIGAGGTLLSLAGSGAGLNARYIVLSGTLQRQTESRAAAAAFLAASQLEVELHALPDGRFPEVWGQVKGILEQVAGVYKPDIVLSPSRHDAHQDHRLLGELVPTAFRDALCLGYEIPKWDGDMGRPSVYLPLSRQVLRNKVALLHRCFPSQRGRDWWDDEVFVGLARLRGMECRSPYAEAFYCSKLTVGLPPS
jgi:LmbE family N-acetylglucosaminyl deacetylase